MAGIWSNASVWSITLVFITYVYMCYGCTPTTPPTTEEKIYFSDSFVHGKVLDIYKGRYTYDTLYTVKLEVYCIFKGPRLDSIINITYAGSRHEPGLCISNKFLKGEQYLVYLDENGEELSPSFNEEPYDAQISEDIAYYCDVEIIEYPKGKNATNSAHECPLAYPDYEDCIAYTTAAPTTPSNKGPTDVVVVQTLAPEDEDKSDEAPETTDVKTSSLEGSGVRVLASLCVTALCLVVSVF